GEFGLRILNFVRIAHPDNEDGDVVRSTPQVGQVDQKTTGLFRRQSGRDSSHFFVRYRAAQAVAANQINVSRANRMRTLNIDFHFRIGTERADDHVITMLRHQVLRRHALAASHFPNPTMIEAELLNLLAANAIDPAVADVADSSSLRAEKQGGAGGTHA